ncbi:MAG: DUF421 domain-containing protein [Hymenobacteraceae bacterium]|nr:DUF421 domain-containing protein [Hymenobacteraceae bacterium]MDX5395928.1 DUF421 domain-containing protein [Hymenobacteraceae bacterium]MDX5511986.1 DUF421 domain-containing protein [Hymenobacteraceae bacterium]
MDSVIRGLAVYIFLMIIFRISGKRTLKDITLFDFVLLLIIAETTQQALLGDDFSIINSFVLISTLVIADIGISLLKQRSKKVERLLDSVPIIIVENGNLIQERTEKERIDKSDILEAARKLHGLERLEQVKYAILEKDGSISIIPNSDK